MIKYGHPEALDLRVVDDPADVHALAVVADAGADGHREVSGHGLQVDGRIHVVRESRAISQLQNNSLSVHKRAVQPGDYTLKKLQCLKILN